MTAGRETDRCPPPGHGRSAGRSRTLRDLRALIERCEEIAPRRPTQADAPPPAAVETALGPLARSAVHEWIGCEGARDAAGANRDSFRPPLLLFIDLVHCALAARPERFVLWIGRRIRPYAVSMTRSTSTLPRSPTSILSRSLFIDPPDDAARLWAIDLALRSPAAGVVVADGRGFDMAQSRRLQLAAKSGGALALLAKPPWDAAKPSAASSRWLISPAPSPSKSIRFNVQLVRCKGAQRDLLTATDASSSGATRSVAPPSLPLSFFLEWNHEKGCVRLPVDVADRPRSQAFTKAG